MNEEKCPCCFHHCKKDSLSCMRGRNYFEGKDTSIEFEEGSDKTDLKERVIREIRRCGHLLHHDKEIKASTFLSDLSEEEVNALYTLLSKVGNKINK